MNYPHTFPLNFAPFTLRTILLLIAGLSISVVVAAQTRSTTASDSTTPAGLAAGASAGSYALSGLENINIYNGNLNFHLPLVHVGGRGSAGYTMMLALNSKKWSVKHTQNSTSETWTPTTFSWSHIEAGYGAGRMQGRHTGFDRHSTTCPGSVPLYETTLTTLTFIGPDGTEYDLRDKSSGGQRLAIPSGCFAAPHYDGALRGKVWVTADGSAATFFSDNDIYDRVDDTNYQRILSPSGYLLLRDGTRYRVDSGYVSWIRDRNGNQVTFWGNAFATDSLGREINVTAIDPYTLTSEDQISFNGFGGTPRTIRVLHDTLDHLLRSDYSPQSLHQLFPQLNGTLGSSGNYNPSLVSSVVLPDGRSYQFRYNSYGELARVVLPTDGAIEYDMASGSGVIQGSNGQGDIYEIYRRVAERRTYADGSTLEGRTVYSPASDGSSLITVNSYDANETMLASEKHYFTGNPIESLFQELDWQGSPVNTYPAWNEGKEFHVESYATNGTSATGLLRSLTTTWQPGATVGGFPVNPQVASTTTTIADVSPNLVTKQTFDYDQYNNRTDVREYDFGAGAVPAYPLRHTHTDYLTAGYDVVNSTAAATVHIRELPTAQTVYAVSPSTGTETQAAQTTMSYDELNYPLVNYGAIAGWNDPGAMRGNLTTTSHWLNSPSGSLVSHAQYDQCGSVTSAWDAKGNQSELSYSGSYAYGFPTSTTSAVPDPSGQHGSTSRFTTASVYDLPTGQVISTTDQNGVITTVDSTDLLERPTQVTRATNQGTTVKSQTTFNYDDVNHTITTTTDQIALADNILKSKTIYDGFGRTTESRQYETATAFITVKTNYDALGRAFQTSNPYRAGENVLWTTIVSDALGRVISVTTPDSAVVSTGYSGNTVTVTDQNSRTRKSVTDALGRLIQVYEDPKGVNGTAPLNYLTSYTYDALDDLISVNQGGQTRSFVYDSLKRLTSATNPEICNQVGTQCTPIPVSYQYDDNGNLTQKTDARGVVSNYSYDALNRNTRVSYTNDPASTPTVNRYYDGWRDGVIASPTIPNSLGRLWQTETSGSAASRTTINGFDALGRPSSESQQFYSANAWGQAYTTQRGYNLAGSVTSQIYPSGRNVTYAYDSSGRTTTFSGTLGDGQQKDYSTEILYSPFGAITKEKFGTDTAIYNKLFYNSRGQLAEMRESSSYTGPTDTTWNRGAIINHYSNNCWGMCGGSTSTTTMTDNNGNLKKQDVYVPTTDALQNAPYTMWTQAYDYDSLNRLQRVNENTGNTQTDWQQEYVYDRYGNRTIHQTNTYGTGVNKKDFTVNTANNRLAVPSGQSGAMTYDNAGNLTIDTYSGNAVIRVYDAENRMRKETQPNSVVAGEYTYNGDGQRVRRKVGGVETWQVYGMDGELLAEYAANAAVTTPQKEYGYRNGQLLITADAAISQLSSQSVSWTNAVGVSVSGNSLTKTAADGWGNAGAASMQAINAGDGYVEFSSSGVTLAGLSHSDTNQNYNTIDFGLHVDGSNLYVYESGVNKGSLGTVTATDVLRVAIESGVIKYKKNGALLYTSTVAPTYPLLVDTALYGNGGTIANVVVGGNFTTNVSWTTAVGVSTSGNSLTKTAANGWGNAGAASTQSIASGDGYVEFTSSGVTMAGLSHTDANQNYNSIDFGLHVDGGNLYVYESGVNRGLLASVTSTDLLRVAIEGGVVKYKKNGTVLYTSTVTPTYPLLVDTSLYSTGSTITNVLISSGSGGTGSSSANINWLVTDQLGTPRMIFDKSGSLATTKRHDYAPFGEELFNGLRPNAIGYAADSTRQKFTSKERDIETGLDYFGARYYSSVQGRFTSSDKNFADQFQTNPQSWDSYSYVRNSPCGNVDVKGRCSAPSGLKAGQVGICIEAFIAAKTLEKGGIRGLGNNRPFSGDNDKLDAKFRTDIIASRTPGDSKSFDVSQKTTAGTTVVLNPLAGVAGPAAVVAKGTADTRLNGASQGNNGSSSTTAAIQSNGTVNFNVSTTAQNGIDSAAGLNLFGEIKTSLNLAINTNTGQVGINPGSSATGFPSIAVYSYVYEGDRIVRTTIREIPEGRPEALKEPMKPIEPVKPR
jgi:RHS repeat-associated protein